MEQTTPTTIDAYIENYPAEIQLLLHQLRRTIAQAAPEATEKISWGMATFVLHGNLVHFSGEKKHIGFHPAPSAIVAFAEELKDFACSKGTVRLPYYRPLPLELVKRMVAFRVQEQKQLAAQKQAGEKSPPPPLRPRWEIPASMAEALHREGLQGAYDARPPYQRNDYISWITGAKQASTQERRLGQMLEELRTGDAYMGRPYKARKPEEDSHDL